MEDRDLSVVEPLPNARACVRRYEDEGLTRDVALDLEVRAARIKAHARRAILLIGRDLAAARSIARYGAWQLFLDRCGITERTAQNYMNVWRRFQNEPQIVDAVSPSVLYALAAPQADPVAVAAVTADVAAGARPHVQAVKARLGARKASRSTTNPMIADVVEASRVLVRRARLVGDTWIVPADVGAELRDALDSWDAYGR